MIMPGTIPAMRSCPTSMFARLASTTVSALGGISASTVPTPMSGPKTHVLAVASLQHVGQEDGAQEGARCNRGAAQCAYDDPHNDRQDRESAPEFPKPFIEHIDGIQPKA